ncbi:hypothetical protein [Bacillus phage CP-51]|uniref:Uncharacterized protein n=1 Tax=Bacillus phage CP-51 TaxID=1391188 RepID=A0A068EQF0_9CAUD|nr:hypothetical protein OZ73_gp157 [Bacillus phage CP-51]AID50592.1 hypothetical protein [Bacillus phage CP-51]
MNGVLVNNKLIPTEVMEEIAFKLEIQEAEWENVEGDMYLRPEHFPEEWMISMWAHADHMNEIVAHDDLPLTHIRDINTHGIKVGVYEESYIDITVYHVLVVNN